MLVVLYTPNGQNLIYHRVWQKDLINIWLVSPLSSDHKACSWCFYLWTYLPNCCWKETRTRFPKYLAETLILVWNLYRDRLIFTKSKKRLDWISINCSCMVTLSISHCSETNHETFTEMFLLTVVILFPLSGTKL